MSDAGQSSKHRHYAVYLNAYRQYKEAQRKYDEHIKSLRRGGYSDADAFVGAELFNELKAAFEKWMAVSQSFARPARRR